MYPIYAVDADRQKLNGASSSPVNASRRPSRDAAHHSGSGRMASPYPMGDFHLLFFASFLAHSESGQSHHFGSLPPTSGLPPTADTALPRNNSRPLYTRGVTR